MPALPGESPHEMKAFCSNQYNFAAIDLGSHTLRLLIARLEHGTHLRPLLGERQITRLAQGFQDSGLLHPEPMAHSLQALASFARRLEAYQVRQVRCGATGVFRKAANAADFIRRIHGEIGLGVAILSEHQEAALSAAGIASVLPAVDRARLCFDLGGSTTELAVLVPSSTVPVFTESVFLGAATVTERFFPVAPAENAALAAAARYSQEQLRPAVARALAVARRFAPGRPPQLIGSAGTVTTLAAMFLELHRYQPQLINGQVLERQWIDATIDRLSRLTLAQRLALVGLEPGREDIILGGALIVGVLLDLLQLPRLLAADAGLLEGLLLDGIEQWRGAHRAPPAVPGPLTWIGNRVKGLP